MALSTQAMVEGFRQVSTSNVSDALDRLKIPSSPTHIGGLWDACPKIVGPAMTLKLAPLEQATGKLTTVIGTLRAIMDAKRGDVLVIDMSGSKELNAFGGVAGATSKHFGLAGVVCDGCSRDIDEFKVLGLPVFGKGFVHQSVRGRVGYDGHDIPIRIGDNTVNPGDFIIGDENGVVVVPKDHLEQVLEIAQFVKKTEDSVIEAVRGGEDPIAAHERVRYDQMLKAA
jgi:regulator of RNase E activity RraA